MAGERQSEVGFVVDRIDGSIRTAGSPHTDERGATFVEGAVCFSLLFFLFICLADVAHLLLLQNILHLGAEEGLAAAQRLESVSIDLESLDLNRPADRDRYRQFITARDRVLTAATRIPLSTFFDLATSRHSIVRLSPVTFDDRVRRGSPEVRRGAAALIRPGEQVRFDINGRERVFNHPTLCPPSVDPQDDTNRPRRPNNSSPPQDDNPGSDMLCESRLLAGSSYTELLRAHPYVIRLCAVKQNFFSFFRPTSEFCEVAVGYYHHMARAQTRPQGAQPTPTIRVNDGNDSCPATIEGVRCGREADGYIPPGWPIYLTPCGFRMRLGFCVEGMSASNFPAGHTEPGIPSDGFPCCSRSYRRVPVGTPGDLCYGHIFDYVCL